MTTFSQDFIAFQGTRVRLGFSIVDDLGAAKVLTGASAAWVLKRTKGSAAIVTKTAGAGQITFPAGTPGRAEVLLLEADLTPLHGKYYHELRITDAAGWPSVPAVGAAQVYRSETL